MWYPISTEAGCLHSDVAKERLLEFESRQLPVLPGDTRLLTFMRAFWLNYDLVLKYAPVSPLEIGELSFLRSKREAIPFHEAFEAVVLALRHEINTRLIETRIAYLEERLGGASQRFRTQFLSASSRS